MPLRQENLSSLAKVGPPLFLGIIGLILILLAVAADKAPNAKKHIMHVAVLIALLGFISIAKMVLGAFAEMSWWRNEPYHIYEASRSQAYQDASIQLAFF